jgi:phage/plasmid primase-like uncharacterized protein
MMAKWNPPDGVEKVIIYGDNDKSFAGQAAAYKLANRLSAKLSVEVKFPIRLATGMTCIRGNDEKKRTGI